MARHQLSQLEEKKKKGTAFFFVVNYTYRLWAEEDKFMLH